MNQLMNPLMDFLFAIGLIGIACLGIGILQLIVVALTWGNDLWRIESRIVRLKDGSHVLRNKRVLDL